MKLLNENSYVHLFNITHGFADSKTLKLKERISEIQTFLNFAARFLNFYFDALIKNLS